MKTEHEKFRFDVENGNPGDFFFLIGGAVPAENTARLHDAEEIFHAQGLASATLDLLQFETAVDLRLHLENMKGQGLGVLHLLNADAWIMQEGCANTNRCRAAGMNRGRDPYYNLDFRTVMWLSEETLGYFSSRAPDFYSWRTGVYRLDAPPREPVIPPPSSKRGPQA